MSVTEYERHQIFQWYEEAMGSERAKIMMNLVPPVGWGEVATRTDLNAVRSELRGEIKSGNAELLRTLFFGMVASNATLVGLVFAAVKLA